MLCRRGLSSFRPARRCCRFREFRQYGAEASSIEPVDLAFKLHSPPQTSAKSPLVILHGLFGSKSNWQSLSKGFARDLGRSVYALDARNHGQSPPHVTHNYMAMAEDVKHFIQQHELCDPIVIGHSMGAKTAMTLALRYPQLVKFLVSVDNAPVDAALHSDFPRYVRAMKEVEQACVTKQSDADAILSTVEADVSIRQFLLTNLVRDAETKIFKWRVPLGTLAKSLDYMGDFPYLPDQARYKGPTLFIRGKYSKYVADEMIPLIGRFFPRFQVRDIEAGHWVQAEAPEEFKQVLTRFIQDEEETLSEQQQDNNHTAKHEYRTTQRTHPAFPQARAFSTSRVVAYEHTPMALTDQEYFRLADSSLNLLLLQLEEVADQISSLDVEYSDGVMNVSIDEVGTYVINRQPPSKQIWLSSPISGPKRFDFVDGIGWTYKDGTVLKDLLTEEWNEYGVYADLEGLGDRES